MKKLFLLAALVFSTPAFAETAPTPVDIANAVAVKMAELPVDVVDFTDIKCHAVVRSQGKTVVDDACRAHVVVSRDNISVFEFFFDDRSKSLAISTSEDEDDIEKDHFVFNANTVRFRDSSSAKVTGKCVSNIKDYLTECHLKSSDGPPMTLDLKTSNSIMMFVKANDKIIVPGTNL